MNTNELQELFNIRTWKPFYQISYIIISIAIVVSFLSIDRTIKIIVLVGCELVYLPFLVKEIRRSFKKKVLDSPTEKQKKYET